MPIKLSPPIIHFVNKTKLQKKTKNKIKQKIRCFIFDFSNFYFSISFFFLFFCLNSIIKRNKNKVMEIAPKSKGINKLLKKLGWKYINGSLFRNLQIDYR